MTEPRSQNSGRDSIRSGLSTVRRRIFLNRFLGILFLDLFVAFSAFGIYLLVHRLLSPGVDPVLVFYAVMGTALVVSVSRAILAGRSSQLHAAVLVDDKLRLKERVSSTVYLRGLKAEIARGAAGGKLPSIEEREDWYELVERDGVRAIAGANLKRQFPVQLPRIALWVLLPVAINLIVLGFVPRLDLLGLQSSREAEASYKNEIEKIDDALKKEIEELAQLDDPENEDAEMKKILDAMNKALEENEKKPSTDQDGNAASKGAEDHKKNALVKFNQLENLLKQGLDQDKFKNLRDFQAKNKALALSGDPLLRKLQMALKDGDLKKASQQLQNLKKQLQNLKNKKKLTKEELDRLKKLSAQLQQLAQNAGAMGLSGSLNSLAGGLNSGNLSQALQGLQQADMDLQSLAQLMQQMQSLDNKLQLVKDSKQDLAKLHKCPNCGKPKKAGKPGGT